MNTNKQKFFENSTQKILRDIDSMNLSPLTRLQARNFVLLFRDSFRLPTVKHAAFACEIDDDYKKFPYDSYGFCKPTSVSFVSLMKSPDWRLMYIGDIWTHGPHYYVMHAPTGRILDMTADQYEIEGKDIPYHMGQPVKQIGRQEQDISIRFLHAVGLDFTKAFEI